MHIQSVSNAGIVYKPGMRPAPSPSRRNTTTKRSHHAPSHMAHSPEIPNINLPQPSGIQHPLVLRVTITVLVSPQRMSNSLNRVDNGTTEVVGRVHLVLVAVSLFPSRQLKEKRSRESGSDEPSTMMRQSVTAVNDGITHSLVGVVERDLGANAPLGTFFRTSSHLGKVSQRIFDGELSSFRRDSVHTFVTHLCRTR